MQRYVKAAGPTLAPFEGKLLVPAIELLATGGEIVHLEGEFKPTRVVVIEFPSMERAQAGYQSDAYQAIINLRLDGSAGSVFIADGV